MKIIVYGIPGPQGSKSFKGMRGGHAILVESSKKVRPWRKAVEAAAMAEMLNNFSVDDDGLRYWQALDGPIVARMVFTMPKPKSAPKTRRTWPCVTPDLSKLCRSTEDALSSVGLWQDDARVVGYSRLWKCYPNEDPEALALPGCIITVSTLAEWEAGNGHRN